MLLKHRLNISEKSKKVKHFHTVGKMIKYFNKCEKIFKYWKQTKK